MQFFVFEITAINVKLINAPSFNTRMYDKACR